MKQIDEALLGQLIEYIDKGQPGHIADRINVLTSLRKMMEQPVQEPETVRVFGVRANGETVDTGLTAPMPPRMKARELVREMFGPFEVDDSSDADLCFAVCEQLIEWLVAQGWSRTAPQPAQQTVSKGRIREIFLTAGFTVKDGQTDLKPYVYEAAYMLLNEAPRPAQLEPDALLREAWAYVRWHCWGECRTPGFSGMPRDGEELDAAIRKHLGVQP